MINFTPDMQLALQAQYDNISENFGFSARYRWEYRPGDEIFVGIGQSAHDRQPRLRRADDPGDDPAGTDVPVLNPIKLPDKATPGEANSVRTVGFWPARIFSSNDPLKVVGC